MEHVVWNQVEIQMFLTLNQRVNRYREMDYVQFSPFCPSDDLMPYDSLHCDVH